MNGILSFILYLGSIVNIKLNNYIYFKNSKFSF